MESNDNKLNRRFAINRSYVPLKLSYLFFMAGEACILPFRGIFMKHLGMSASQTGLIWSFDRIFALTSPPLLGIFTDKTQKPKAILITLLILAALFSSAMYFIPVENISVFPLLNIQDKTEICIHSGSGNISLMHLNKVDNIDTASRQNHTEICLPMNGFHLDQVSISVQTLEDGNKTYCNNVSNAEKEFYVTDEEIGFILHCNHDDKNHITDDEYGATFFGCLLLIVLASSAMFGAKPILESSVLAILGEANRHKFGNQRLFASIGYGSAAFVVGVLIDQAKENPYNNREYLSMFSGVLLFWFLGAFVASRLPIKPPQHGRKFTLGDIKNIVLRKRIIALLILCTFYGMTSATQEIFLFWLAEVKLKAPAKILGVTTLIGAIIDLPFCMIAGKLIRKFGHNALMVFGNFIFSIRILCYYFVTEPWQLIPVESLRGITWGLTFVVLSSYTAKISPKSLESTTMGIVHAITWGFGYSIGAFLGGYLFEIYGGDSMFLIFSLSLMVVTFGYAAFCVFDRRFGRKEEDSDNSEDEDIKNGGLEESKELVNSASVIHSPGLKHRNALLENVILPTPTSSNMSLNVI